MAETAPQIQYRQEMIAGFEVTQSLLRESVTTEIVTKGNAATFLVSDSGGARAVTRDANGLIPGRGLNLTQHTVNLEELHDVPEQTEFDVFSSQGNIRAELQRTSLATIHRSIDDQIIRELDTATVTTGAPTSASLDLALKAKTILGNAEVDAGGMLFAAITSAFEAYLLRQDSFSSADYVTRKPIDSGETSWDDTRGYYRWMGINWIVHPSLPGKGTANETCFMYHKSAIGSAANTETMTVVPDTVPRQGMYYVRCSIYAQAKLLQNQGVVKIPHDGSGMSA